VGTLEVKHTQPRHVGKKRRENHRGVPLQERGVLIRFDREIETWGGDEDKESGGGKRRTPVLTILKPKGKVWRGNTTGGPGYGPKIISSITCRIGGQGEKETVTPERSQAEPSFENRHDPSKVRI